MDDAYNQHSSRARRKNRSTPNVHHLSLAPMTTRLPLADDPSADIDATVPLPSAPAYTGPPRHSYLQGRSSPSTPSLLAPPPRSRSGSRHISPLPKSKSAVSLRPRPQAPHAQLNPNRLTASRAHSGYATPAPRRLRDTRVDSDWLLRAGALLSSEAREAKGQAWLVSRESSTSLTALRNGYDSDDDASPGVDAPPRRPASITDATTWLSPVGSDTTSRIVSRSHSRVGFRATTLTPRAMAGLDYFSSASSGLAISPERDADAGIVPPAGSDDNYLQPHLTGPDFVNLDEALEELRDAAADDEAAVRRLVRRGNSGLGSWVGRMFGWTLSSVSEMEGDGEDDADEEDEDEDEEEVDVDDDDNVGRRASELLSGVRRPHFPDQADLPEDGIPAPQADEGSWADAAWLLSVAKRVLL